MSSNMTMSENVPEVEPDALVGMDQEGVIRFVNYQTESLFGHDRDDLVGQPIQTLVPEYLWEVYSEPVSYTHLRAHETDSYLVCRLLLEKKKKYHINKINKNK